ncbi:MAG: DNA-protecting protein DprA [Brumimicrobium sp.]|nr:DNA-protecting protein DprA [Brumimicrobium sp.]
MKNNYLNYQVALTLLEGVGAVKAKALLAYVGNVEDIFNSKLNLRTSIPGFAKERYRMLNREGALQKAAEIVQFVEKNDLDTTFYTEKRYPKRLKECMDAPMLLYHKGDIDLNYKYTIAIVGTRNMTSYGKQIINELIYAIADCNIQIISGLALGVDGYVHQKCLEVGIPTIGVLGHGLDRLYPSSHRKLASKMLNTQGCGLLTEFPNGTNPDKENFPQRNRIVAGMADATIVIESDIKGGSLITANLANDYNRDVFAYPGNVFQRFSKGCNQLIAQNKAQIITCGKDLIEIMGWEEGNTTKNIIQTNLFEGLNGDEKLVVSTIQEFEAISLDSIALRLQKPVNLLSSLLLGLELKGLVLSLPGKKYSLNGI